MLLRRMGAFIGAGRCTLKKGFLMLVPDATHTPERRAFQRYPCRAALSTNVELVDIGEGGAQLECGWEIPVGAIVPLPMESALRWPREKVVSFKVLHVRSLEEGGRYRVHGCFLNRSALGPDFARSVVCRFIPRE